MKTAKNKLNAQSIWPAFAFATALLLAGCATAIRIQVERPPILNTSGLRRIAVMPFNARTNESAYRETAQYATNAASVRIQETNFFTMVNPQEINRLRISGQSMENYADALFSGQITRIDISMEDYETQHKDKNGNIIINITYTTTVELEFNYYFTRTRDGSLIGPVQRKGSKSLSSRDTFPAAGPILADIVDAQLRYLNRDIAPHIVTESRAMAAEKTNKDKTLKARMKETLALVKGGSYNAALDSYLDIYSAYKSVAAAENASILYEAMGQYETAVNFMQQVFEETGNPAARNVLARLNKIIQDRETIAGEYSGQTSLTEKAAAHASEEILKILPSNAKVWIFNNSGGNPLAEEVADNLSAGFIRRGITIVDRQNSRLIEAEQGFQYSGSVNDSELVSIGNAAGANIIVTLGISGTGAMRRLQVRVLDIERRIPIMQSDTSDKWSL